MASQGRAKVISVGGGKGGVGKSLVAANLGVAMAQEGVQVVVVDGDLGTPNQHTLFGLSRPGPTLQAFVDRSIDSLEQVRTPVGIPNLTLLPGAAAMVGAANINHGQKVRLVRHIRDLKAQVVIIDVGAGASFNVLDLFDAADLRLTVMLPQLTSIENGYAFLKGAVFRELRRIAVRRGKAALVDDSPEASEATGTIPQLVARLRAQDGELASVLERTLEGFGARIVGNQIFEQKESNVLYAISRMARDFLGLAAPVLGNLRASRKIHASIGAGRPFLLDESGEESAATMRRVARALLEEEVTSLRRLREWLEASEAPSEPEAEPDERGALPATIDRYQRAYQRQPVACPAKLIYGGASIGVQLQDVSCAGAMLLVEKPPVSGSRAVLIFSDLEGQPTAACVVRHASPESHRAGVEFSQEQQLAQRLVEEIVLRFPARTGGDDPVEG
jgi:flagellar biosynthesis protein FlhG